MVNKISKVITTELYGCDKCGHNWASRKKERPKICPKCKTKKWNMTDNPLTFKSIEEYYELLKKRYGVETANCLRSKYDKDFAKKKMLEEIESMNKEIVNCQEKKEQMERLIKIHKEYLKNLYKEFMIIDKQKIQEDIRFLDAGKTGKEN